jgi:hypothetical protein
VIFFVAEWIGYEIGNGPAIFELPACNRPEGQAMGQQIQGWRSASGQRLWLSMLIDTMEAISRPELRAVPCDDQLLSAVRAQLARPALVRTPYASAYSLRN